MIDLINILLGNCIIASSFFVFLLLLRPFTEKRFSQGWHYLAYRVNLLLFFIPIAWIYKIIAPLKVELLPKLVVNEIMQQVEIAPNLNFNWAEQILEANKQFTEIPISEKEIINWSGILIFSWLTVSVCLIF